MNHNITSVDDYISGFPKEVQHKLSTFRAIMIENAPEATEQMLYEMPAYKTFKKPLVYFAAYTNHIGLYATPAGNQAFDEELKRYKTGKGSIQFPHKNPLPIDLITRII